MQVVVRNRALMTSLAPCLEGHFEPLHRGDTGFCISPELQAMSPAQICGLMGGRFLVEPDQKAPPPRHQWLEKTKSELNFVPLDGKESLGIYLGFGFYPSVRTLGLQSSLLMGQKRGEDGLEFDYAQRLQDYFLALGIAIGPFEEILRREMFFSHPSLFLNRLRNAFGGRGPAVAINNLCVSSLQALGEAYRAVKSGRVHRALVVGVEEVSALSVLTFARLGAHSKSEDPFSACLPFDLGHNGIVLGDALGMVVLEGVEAPKPSDTVLQGYATSNNLHHLTDSPQDGRGLIATMKGALGESGQETVDLVTAHGTGTRSNDPSELRAIAAVLGKSSPVQSLKGHLGHTLAAAGMVNFLLCEDQLRRGRAVQTRGLENPIPEGEAVDLIREPMRDLLGRRGLINAAGFGGFNASLVLKAGKYE